MADNDTNTTTEGTLHQAQVDPGFLEFSHYVLSLRYLDRTGREVATTLAWMLSVAQDSPNNDYESGQEYWRFSKSALAELGTAVSIAFIGSEGDWIDFDSFTWPDVGSDIAPQLEMPANVTYTATTATPSPIFEHDDGSLKARIDLSLSYTASAGWSGNLAWLHDGDTTVTYLVEPGSTMTFTYDSAPSWPGSWRRYNYDA